MWRQSCRNFLTGAAALAIFAGCAWANHHHELNGTWQLNPERSDFNGGPALQSGTVTINDREGNISVSRNFSYDNANGGSTTTTFSTDARANTSIKEPGFRSKTRWDGDVLKTTITRDGNTVVERYSLRDDGTMLLTVERPGQVRETLLFQRQ